MEANMQTYYTIREAMELLKVSQRSIYSYLKSGKLEGTKTASGTWRISKGSILRFLGEPEAPAEAFNEDTLKLAKEAIGE